MVAVIICFSACKRSAKLVFVYQVELADTKARLEATKASMGKEITLLKEKLQKKAEKVVSDLSVFSAVIGRLSPETF